MTGEVVPIHSGERAARPSSLDILAPLLVALLLAIHYLPGLFGAGAYVTTDGSDSGIPQMIFAASWIRRGVFPLWNPAACFGLPHLAYAILSPLSPTVLLYVFLPPSIAPLAEIILLSTLASAGWIALGRRFDLSAPARALLALLAAADSTSGAVLTSVLWAMALLPFLVAFAEDLSSAPSLRNAARFAAAFGFLWLWGAFAYLAYRFSIALLFYIALRSLERSSARPIAFASAAFAAGCALAAIQLVPFLAFLRLTPRLDPSLQFGSDGSVGAFGYLALFAPGIAGTLAQRDVWTFAPELAALPIPILALVPLGIAARRRPALLALTIIAAVLAAGHHLPFHGALLDRLPGYGLVRNHASWGIVVELACLVFAGAALSSDEAMTDRRRRHLVGAYALLAAAAATFLLAGVAIGSLDAAGVPWLMRFREHLGALPEGSSPGELAAHYAAAGGVVSRALVSAGLYWLFCIALVVAAIRRPSASSAYRSCLAGFVVVSVLAALFRAPLNFFPGAPLSAAESVARWRVDRPDRRLWSESYLWSFTSALATRPPYQLLSDMKAMGMMDLPDDANSRTATLSALMAEVPPNVGLSDGAHCANGQYGLFLSRMTEYLAARPGAGGAYTFERPALPWASLPGLAILAIVDKIAPPGFHVLELAGRMTVFEADAVRPRLERRASWSVFPDSTALLADLAATAADTERARVIESDAPRGLAASGGSGSVALEGENPNRVAIRTAGPSPALVILRDACAPGWRGSIDGDPARVVPVDHAFRGIFVPAGEHRVEFVYDPWEVRCGAAISFFAALAILFALVRRTTG